MEKTRKMIREIMEEAFGVSDVVDDLAKLVTKEIVDELLYRKQKNMTNFQVQAPIIALYVPEDISRRLPIGQISIRIENSINDIGSSKIIDGKYITNETRSRILNNKTFFDIKLELRMEWDFVTDISGELRSFFEHELHHVFDHITRIDKSSKTNSFNLVYRRTQNTAFEIVRNNPSLLEFLTNFYLSIPQEVNARIQEAFSDIEKHLELNDKELMLKLHQTRAVKNAASMINYDKSEVLKLPKDILIQFINIFNKEMRHSLIVNGFEGKDFNFIHTNIKDFFSYWENRINYSGDKLFRKITRMVSHKKNMNETTLLFNMDRDMLNEVLWYKPCNENNLLHEVQYSISGIDTEEDKIWNSLLFDNNF
jgi:hypothetical protein